MTGLELQEQIARIEREQAHIHQLYASTDQSYASRDRLRQETWWYPAVIIFSGMTAGAALFAAGGVFVGFLK